MVLGERVRTLRGAFNLESKELAKRIEVSPATMSNLENGKMPNPPLKILYKLSDVFNVSVDYLLGRTDVISGDLEERIKLSPAEEESFRKIMAHVENMFRQHGDVSEQALKSILHFTKYTFMEDVEQGRKGKTTKVEDVE